MKKIFLYIAIVLVGFSFTACDEELEIWDSETLDYSGRYVVELQSEDQEDVYYDYSEGLEFDFFNTSKNVPNEMWINDLEEVFPLKNKFFFDGNPSSFKSKSLDFDDLGDNTLAIIAPEDKPTDLGESITEDRDYIRCAVVEGKILPLAATTVGGNQADSLFVKLRLLSGTVTFKSYEIAEVLRKDPEIREFDWEVESMTYDADLDETYVISGHRYTGFEEDSH